MRLLNFLTSWFGEYTSGQNKVKPLITLLSNIKFRDVQNTQTARDLFLISIHFKLSMHIGQPLGILDTLPTYQTPVAVSSLKAKMICELNTFQPDEEHSLQSLDRL